LILLLLVPLLILTHGLHHHLIAHGAAQTVHSIHGAAHAAVGIRRAVAGVSSDKAFLSAADITLARGSA
jgi:hypothetical protein